MGGVGDVKVPAVAAAPVEGDPEVEKALAKARAALAQSSAVESPKALLETELSKAPEELL